MATFPSPLERTVASALLVLSTQPPKLMIGCCDGETKGKTNILISSTESESCGSSLTTHQSSSRKQRKMLRIIAAVARCHEFKLKVPLPYSVSPLYAAFCLFFVNFVVKKRRSRIYLSSDNRKISSFRSLISSNIAKDETTSCLSSSSSSGISSARSQRKPAKAEKIQRKRHSGGSNHMCRRAEAILKLLSGGCFSEVNIRRVLGDSPDTSKALRMLLRQEEVKRSGTGGQKDPYIYTIA
ncbi:uncharacterized protein LOC120183954 [Hibiscus syriacus]|uniref:uncharacterized protein LOC120183954 n=1 Tax=Hibiscus syriacus TaxID=106335 RepID=UPI001923B89C|nr:uncharacterized protein LOC120183954 [Hibiscus syriacus]